MRQMLVVALIAILFFFFDQHPHPAIHVPLNLRGQRRKQHFITADSYQLFGRILLHSPSFLSHSAYIMAIRAAISLLKVTRQP